MQDRFYEPTISNDIGTTLTILGHHDEAIAMHQRALSLARQTHQPYEQARAHAGIAAALRKSDVDGALAARRAAYAAFGSMGIQHRWTMALLRS